MDMIYEQMHKRLVRIEAELWIVIGTMIGALIMILILVAR
jgi:hypothetical protein